MTGGQPQIGDAEKIRREKVRQKAEAKEAWRRQREKDDAKIREQRERDRREAHQ